MLIKSNSSILIDYFKTCDFILVHKGGDHKFIYLRTNPYLRKLDTLSSKQNINNGALRKNLLFKREIKGIPKLVGEIMGFGFSEATKKNFEEITHLPWDPYIQIEIKDENKDLLVKNAKIYNVIDGIRMKEDKTNNIDVWVVESKDLVEKQRDEIKKGRGKGINFGEIIDLTIDKSGEKRIEAYKSLGKSAASSETRADFFKGSNVPINWENKFIHLTDASVKEFRNSFLINHPKLKKDANVDKRFTVLKFRPGGDFCDVSLPEWLYDKLRIPVSEIKI